MDLLFEDDSLDILIQDPDFGAASFEHNQPLLETCLVEDETLVLPSQICENAAILTEMLSSDLLSQALSPEDVQHLNLYLPDFGPDLKEEERKRTWSMLFSGQNFHFGNPVETFAWKMESGLYNPDIAHTRKLFLKLQRSNANREQRNYHFNLLQNVLVSRQRLIEAASQLPPGQAVRGVANAGCNRPAPSGSKALPTDERVRKRYFEELKALDCLSSEDENYPEGAPAPLTKKQRRHLCSIQGSLSCDLKPVQSTLTHDLYNRPIVVDGIINRTDRTGDEDATVKSIKTEPGKDSNHKVPSEGVPPSRKGGSDSKRTGPEEFKPVVDVLSRVYGLKNPYDVNEETYKVMLARHRALKLEGRAEVEQLPGETSLEDIGQRVRMCSLNKRPPPPRILELPKKSRVIASGSSSSDEMESEVELPKKIRVKRSTPTKPPRTKSIKARPLDQQQEIAASIDAVVVPPPSPPPPVPTVEPADVVTENVLAEPDGSIGLVGTPIKQEVKLERMEVPSPPSPPPPPPPPPSLTEDTHLSFFHLVRQILLNSDGATGTLKQIADAVVLWNSSPITPLNEWYTQLMVAHQRLNGWTALIQSALEFLADQGLVSTVTEAGLPALHSWTTQCGVKDSDSLLQDLAGIWLQQQQHQQSQHDSSMEGSKLDVECNSAANASDLNDSMIHSPSDAAFPLGASLADLGEEMPDMGASSLFDSSDVVHPPRCVTSWTVRPSSEEEKANYREQERQRYLQPHKAFTFRQHGYESIVGPVKGVYQPGQGMAQASTKVRGHNLMVPERPACVTLLSLVRDAAARLPNGEGTRAEICELMKESQYLAIGADASIHSVVSGALDRLHYEADPCVKYDSTRKVWIYLHRHRTEAEFEQLHKQHQGMPSRVKKPRSERRSSTLGGSPGSAKGQGSKASASSTSSSAVAAISAVPGPSVPPSPVTPVAAPAPTPAPAAASPIQPPPLPPPPSLPMEVQATVQPVAVPAAPTIVPPAVLKSVPKLNPSIMVTVRQQQDVKHNPAAPVVVTSPSVASLPSVVYTSSSVTVTSIGAAGTTTVTSSSGGGPATIQTFQITTSSGVQTIRVAAPANLPTALLAKTLQMSAQQSVLHGQKVTGSPTLLNGNASIKQVILSPPSAKSGQSTLLSHQRQAVPSPSGSGPTGVVVTTTGVVTSTGHFVPSTSTQSIIRLSMPGGGANVPVGVVTTTARARLPANPVRLVSRQGLTMAAAPGGASGGSAASPVHTYVIRPTIPTTTTTTTTTTTSNVQSAPPRLVMVNNKLINLSATPVAGSATSQRMPIRTPIPVNMATVRKATPGSVTAVAAGTPRPMLARVVTGPGGAATLAATTGGQHQQVITLENLLSLTNAHQKAGGGAKTGVVQLPLSALAGLNVGGTSSSGQPTTVLLQNVKGGAQSILLPAGFQGGTINIRGVRLATVSQPSAGAAASSASSGQPVPGQPTAKPTIVARLVAPPPQQQAQPQAQPQPPKSSDL